MLFIEPPETPYDVKFSVAGIPVRVHPLFWMFTILPVLGSPRFEIPMVLLWLGCVFISILVHELGHALVARYFGARPWITLYGFGGLAAYRPQDFAPGSDPTTRSLLISVAGPVAGFMLAGITIFSVAAAGIPVRFSGLFVDLGGGIWGTNAYLAYFLTQFIFVNVMWNLINLLPVFPLDGGQILTAILTRVSGMNGYLQAIMTSMFLGAAVAVFAAVQWKSAFLAILFAYLAFQNYQIWQSIQHRR